MWFAPGVAAGRKLITAKGAIGRSEWRRLAHPWRRRERLRTPRAGPDGLDARACLG